LADFDHTSRNNAKPRGQLLISGVAVEKLFRAKIAKIKLRQDAL